jgi:hypothetical protein
MKRPSFYPRPGSVKRMTRRYYYEIHLPSTVKIWHVEPECLWKHDRSTTDGGQSIFACGGGKMRILTADAKLNI